MRQPGVRRSALLIGVGSAAALALVALFEPTDGQDRGRLVDPPAAVGGLVHPPALANRDRPAVAPEEGSLPGPLLVADRPAPLDEVGHVAIDQAAPPAASAPAPVSVAGLSAEVRPTIETMASGLAADGKFAAIAVRAGTLTGTVAEADDPLYELGHRLQVKGEVAEAIEAYRMAAEAHPEHAATYYERGYLLQKRRSGRRGRRAPEVSDDPAARAAPCVRPLQPRLPSPEAWRLCRCHQALPGGDRRQFLVLLVVLQSGLHRTEAGPLPGGLGRLSEVDRGRPEAGPVLREHRDDPALPSRLLSGTRTAFGFSGRDPGGSHSLRSALLGPPSRSSSSIVRGQSFLKRRESARSASSWPPVWQRGQ